MVRFLIFVNVTLFLLCGCNKKKTSYTSFFVEPMKNEMNICIQSIVLDTMYSENINTSFVGFGGIYEDQIFFADKYFCWLYEFDRNLNLIDRKLGQGRGPTELTIGSIMGYGISPDNGNHYFIGGSNDIYRYDPDNNKTNTFSCYPGNLNEVPIESPEYPYDSPAFYGLIYNNMKVKIHKDELYFKILGSNSFLEIPFSESDRQSARIIKTINRNDGSTERLLGRMSPAIKLMSACRRQQFDIDSNGYFYVSFEADSLIYVYDNNYNIDYSFGFSGKIVNQDYIEFSTDDEFEKGYSSERATKGYYSSITVTNGYVFRTYKTGGTPSRTRMQIYRDRTLLGDVEVPDNFEVMGYIEPYYYSDFIGDDEEETLKIYRFSL